jgi:hypothetical protein
VPLQARQHLTGDVEHIDVHVAPSWDNVRASIRPSGENNGASMMPAVRKHDPACRLSMSAHRSPIDPAFSAVAAKVTTIPIRLTPTTPTSMRGRILTPTATRLRPIRHCLINTNLGDDLVRVFYATAAVIDDAVVHRSSGGEKREILLV